MQAHRESVNLSMLGKVNIGCQLDGRCFSTLKRMKSFLRSKMPDGLNALAMISIEQEFIRSPDLTASLQIR